MDKKENKTNDYLYKVERVCGNGSFGIVFQAKVIHTGEVVAIKKVYQDRRYKNREYTITKELVHPNIVKLMHSFYTTGEKRDEIYLNLVMNYVSDNLNRIIRNYNHNKEDFPLFTMKLYSFQIARALNYIHSKSIAHRDIKPQNILIDPSTNRVYLCDFGSAKVLRPDDNNNVSYICSRYYRAPELILDSQSYNESIDIWSFGCVIAEMIKGKPFLQGDSMNSQISKIVEIFGSIKEEELTAMGVKKKDNNFLNQAQKAKGIPIEDVFPNMPKELLNLLSRIFVYNPKKRITALEIMAHPFFNDIKNVEIFQNGKYIVPNIFDFSKKEIQMSKNKEIFKKIIPEWCDSYKNIE
ncbi:MAG: serine/threonine-protein kinase [archaeon]|nr:serine/threonine-protein kinase [archaeon]